MQCDLQGAALEDHLEALTVSECSGASHVKTLLSELYWLLVFFQVQFRVMVVTYKYGLVT